MNRTRHWKQHYDPEADLIFAKRLRMGDDPKKPCCLPGERLSEQQREKLGPARVRRWFENGMLSLADFVAPEPQRELALRARDEKEAELEMEDALVEYGDED